MIITEPSEIGIFSLPGGVRKTATIQSNLRLRDLSAALEAMRTQLASDLNMHVGLIQLEGHARAYVLKEKELIVVGPGEPDKPIEHADLINALRELQEQGALPTLPLFYIESGIMIHPQ